MELEKKTMVALAIILMALAWLSPVVAELEVPTTAVITGSGSPPFFKWKWELPDEDNTTTCTQIFPQPFGNKTVTCYMVATDPNGPGDVQRVYINVFHPDGTKKYQLDARELNKTTEWTEIEWAIDTGVNNTCIPPAVAADMKHELEQCEARAFKVNFTMHYHQPPGNYTVIAYAVDTAGAIGSFTNTFEYYSIKVLAIDFAAGINFGEIVPCVEKIVSGDWNMSTPTKPTVRSGGNDPLWISVHFTTMIGDATTKEIEDFDAVFKTEKLTFKACTWANFTNPLDPCETQKMDFSVHAPMGTPADTYRGNMTIAISDP